MTAEAADYRAPYQFSVDPSVGDVVCHFERTDRFCLIIDMASSRVLLAADFLDRIRAGAFEQFGVTLKDNVVRMNAANRTVIYRIGEKVPNMHAYYAEWPD